MTELSKFHPKFHVFLLLFFYLSTGGLIIGRKCFNERRPRNSCNRDQFRCVDGNCIPWHRFCDRINHCGDNSDEQYCSSPYSSCSERSLFVEQVRRPAYIKCDSRCIPDEWLCDGIEDCSDGSDEGKIKCGKERFIKQKAFTWIYNRTFNDSNGMKWNAYIHKAAVALILAEPINRISCFQKIITRDVSIEFLSRLSQKNLSDIPSADLAASVNAMLVTCLNPRKFYGMNLIKELRYRVENQNYTSPYVLLTLCNAGDNISEMDKRKLAETFWSSHRKFWTDMQAMVVMALSCAKKQPGNTVDNEMMKGFIHELQTHQYRNGSIQNIQTTALVLQALYAAEIKEYSDKFDGKKAFEQIKASHLTDGSFGNFMKTYYILPVLNCKSLADINSDHCQYLQTDEYSALQGLTNRVGPKKRVQYSLWFGDQNDLEVTTALRVPANMSLYGIIETASEIDDRYRFKYLVKNRKPYLNGISGFLDDPEKGKFWFLYVIKDGEPSPIANSPADVMPKDNEHYVMWYRSGSWID